MMNLYRKIMKSEEKNPGGLQALPRVQPLPENEDDAFILRNYF